MNVKSMPMVLVAIATFMLALGSTAAAQPYTLEICRDPAEGGAYHVDPEQESYMEGAVITVAAVPFPGFRFVGWEGDYVVADSELAFPITADTTLTAVFEAAAEVTTEFEVLVTSEPQEAGWVTREPADVTYGPGDVITLTAIAADGYVFAGWTGDAPESAALAQPELQLTVNGDLEITANFEAAAGVLPDDGGDLDEPVPATRAQGSSICGMLGMFFWPMTILCLAAIRRR